MRESAFSSEVSLPGNQSFPNVAAVCAVVVDATGTSQLKIARSKVSPWLTCVADSDLAVATHVPGWLCLYLRETSALLYVVQRRRRVAKLAQGVSPGSRLF